MLFIEITELAKVMFEKQLQFLNWVKCSTELFNMYYIIRGNKIEDFINYDIILLRPDYIILKYFGFRKMCRPTPNLRKRTYYKALHLQKEQHHGVKKLNSSS